MRHSGRWIGRFFAMLLGAVNVNAQANPQDDAALLSETWKTFARTLDPSARVRAVLKDGRVLKGSVLGVNESALVLRPSGRLPEPEVTIELESIKSLLRDGGTKSPRALAPGERVRLRTLGSAATLTGTLATMDAERLSLFPEGHSGPVQVERRQLRSADISGGRRSLGRRVFKGATLGFALGVACGAVAGLANGDRCWFEEGRCYNSTTGNLIMGLTFGAAAFNIITLPAGALLGAAAIPTERWNSVPRPELTLTVVPRKQGGAVALRLRF